MNNKFETTYNERQKDTEYVYRCGYFADKKAVVNKKKERARAMQWGGCDIQQSGCYMHEQKYKPSTMNEKMSHETPQ